MITRQQIENATGTELDRLVELIVFGDDLTSAKGHRLASAVADWGRSSDRSFRFRILDPDAAFKTMGPGYIVVTNGSIRVAIEHDPSTIAEFNIWNSRIGSPYQQSIEDHVAAYRVAPRPFSTDWNLMQLAFDGPLKIDGYKSGAMVTPIKTIWEVIVYQGGRAVAVVEDAAIPVAVWRAACLVALEKQHGWEATA